eukprot:jgi/Botrbrau1/12920/Bobra.92_1s0001.2
MTTHTEQKYLEQVVVENSHQEGLIKPGKKRISFATANVASDDGRRATGGHGSTRSQSESSHKGTFARMPSLPHGPEQPKAYPTHFSAFLQHRSRLGRRTTSDISEMFESARQSSVLDALSDPTKHLRGFENAHGEMGEQLDPTDLPEGEMPVSCIQRLTFWLPIVVGVGLLVAGWTLYARYPMLELGHFELWRWLFFWGTVVPIHLFCSLIMRFIIRILETWFLTFRGIMYYVIGIRVWLDRSIRLALILLVFGLMFRTHADTGEAIVSQVYWIVIRVLSCAFLACIANVVKTLLAKLLSTRFYKASYFEKMEEALKKEYYILTLSVPKPGDLGSYSPRGKGSFLLRKVKRGLAAISSVTLGGKQSAKDLEMEAELGVENEPFLKAKSFSTLTPSFQPCTVHQSSKSICMGQIGRPKGKMAGMPDSGPAAAFEDQTAKGIKDPSDPAATPERTMQSDLASQMGKDSEPAEPVTQISRTAVHVGDTTTTNKPAVRYRITDLDLAVPLTGNLGPTVRFAGNVGPSVRSNEDVGPTVHFRDDGGPAARSRENVGPATRFSDDLGSSERCTDGLRSAIKKHECRPRRRNEGAVHFKTLEEDNAGDGVAELLGDGMDDAVKKPLLSATDSQRKVRAVDFGAVSEDEDSNKDWDTDSNKESEFTQGNFRMRSIMGKNMNEMASLIAPRQANITHKANRRESAEMRDPGTMTYQPMPPTRADMGDVPMLEIQNSTAHFHLVEGFLRRNQMRTLVDQLGDLPRSSQKNDDGSLKKKAMHLGYCLFMNIKLNMPGDSVTLQDLEYFFEPTEAKEAMKAFDIDGSGNISLAELQRSVEEIYTARTHLAATLNDTRTIVGKLERLLGVCIHILFTFFYMIIWNVNLSQIWLTISSLLLSFVFVFGNSIRTIYESALFLFVVHPFDVGDQVLVGPNTDHCTVQEIALLNTTLVKWDGSKIICPNQKLWAESLVNLTHSGNKGDTYKVKLDINTDPNVYEMVRRAVKAHVTKEKKDFTGECSVNLKESDDPMKVNMAVWWNHCYNATNSRIFAAKSRLILVIAKALIDTGASYTCPGVRDALPDSRRGH